MQDTTKCKICNDESKYVFSKTILNKHEGHYYRCSSCGFMQLDNPHWFEEAYSDAITELDIGLVYRNLILKNKTEKLIGWFFKNKINSALDFGGGYGMFVRMMRDKGYNFYRQDSYCENIFAKHFDVNDIDNISFDLLTAFELFEHLVDPNQELKIMLKYSNLILFSTELQPKESDKIKDWWYLTPETGQHLSFYTKESLKILAEMNNLKYFEINNGLHLITKENINHKKLKFLMSDKNIPNLLSKIFLPKSKSLLQKDYKFILNKINDRKLEKGD